ncbi:glycoside hydrolase family 13 protein [Kushneria phosphatilytica]|uniref:Glycoside hydrolase family 13 protein n=1 Tax=Kushneria phosphatilytica TaxID=657387 RepID=A0A1S1NMX4_9GAMM|nr:glycoside hydrolase family 13 protein [Kushneria phosphatilytica]OHV08667.1 alpha-amylase [Kushneria phosphatilytica]QEL12384.1 glycoside hydrolase family 13 protein [Kushneria phosphatilytica]
MTQQAWWRSAVIYQIYPRSFMDGNGDGLGDLPGIVDRLPYLARLGVDAIWLSPFYRSPQADAGYDVADYRDVDPLFGQLADFDAMLKQAHALDMRIIVDLVPNHTSDEHAWFRAALAAPEGSPERARYMFREGQGEHGELPPNNWQSVFGGAAWTRVPGERQWYLHLFDSKQPDLDWRNPEVRDEFDDVLRFWLDRGVDGFRVDVAHGLIKQPGLPDWDGSQAMVEGGSMGPMWDQDEVHDIYRRWHQILEEYDGDRMMVAEAWVRPQARLAHYIRRNEMQQAFNFDYLLARWDAGELREVIDDSLAQTHAVGAPTTWVMSNHDGVRHASRLGLSQPGARPHGIDAHGEQPDEALGLRRARAAIMLTLALPGSVYLYQGEELGLPDHTTMAAEYRQDPTYRRTGGREIGRDGCRVPLPWQADAPAYGFGCEGMPWLPQPETFHRYAVDVQEADDTSTLTLYRQLLALRREHDLGEGQLEWLESPSETALMLRNGRLTALINLGSEPVALPSSAGSVLACSLPGPLPVDTLSGNAAVWLVD